MNYTQNYQLCLWDEDDRILMEDFNSDNEKTDAAMAGFGNCKIETGTYTGGGNYGMANPNTLTFSGKPLLVLAVSHNTGDFLLLAHNCTSGAFISWSAGKSNIVSADWTTENAVTWYGSDSAAAQANFGLHHYIALLAADGE